MNKVHVKNFESAPLNREDVTKMLKERLPDYSLEQPFYNDPDLFRIDMEEIFAKEWLFAGLTCEIPKKGNFITLDIGDNPVTIVRGNNGEVNAFHNVCRHRGSKICLKHRGKTAKLVCPYHQWTYELDGSLIYAGSEMGEDFDKKKFPMKKIHCRTAGGYIFISLADNPPPIDEFLDDLSHYLEPYDLENAKVAVESVMMEKANWKLVIENNRECYHCEGSHPELLGSLQAWDDTEDPMVTPDFLAQVAEKQAHWDECEVPHLHKSAYNNRNRIVRMPLKEGVHAMTMTGEVACKKLMGRISSPDMARCGSCTCQIHGIMGKVIT